MIFENRVYPWKLMTFLKSRFYSSWARRSCLFLTMYEWLMQACPQGLRSGFTCRRSLRNSSSSLLRTLPRCSFFLMEPSITLFYRYPYEESVALL